MQAADRFGVLDAQPLCHVGLVAPEIYDVHLLFGFGF